MIRPLMIPSLQTTATTVESLGGGGGEGFFFFSTLSPKEGDNFLIYNPLMLHQAPFPAQPLASSGLMITTSRIKADQRVGLPSFS